MRKFAFGLAAATSFIAGPVLAADMPIKAARAPVAPMVAVYNWTGCYLGAQVGAQSATAHSTVNYPGPPAANASNDLTGTGFIGGGLLGCNWQAPGSAFVMGVEGDISWADQALAGEIFRFGNVIDHFDARATLGTQGSARARLGYAWDRMLVYVAGGVAFASVNASTIVTRDGVGSLTTSTSGTVTGWTIGSGFEVAFTPNWLGRVEYRYTDYGALTINVPAFAFPAAGTAYSATDRFRTHDIRVALSYKFR